MEIDIQEKTIEKLIEKYSPIVTSVAGLYATNKQDFEDLKQELMLKLLICIKEPKPNNRTNPKLYIKNYLEERAIKWATKKQIELRNTITISDLMKEDKKELSVKNSLIYDYFLSCYKEHKYGNIAKMRYVYGYEIKDIAEKKGLSRKSISSKIDEFNEWFLKKLEGDE